MKFIKALVFHRRNFPKVNEFNYNSNYISICLPIKDKKTNFFSLNKFNILSIYEKKNMLMSMKICLSGVKK